MRILGIDSILLTQLINFLKCIEALTTVPRVVAGVFDIVVATRTPGNSRQLGNVSEQDNVTDNKILSLLVCEDGSEI